MKKSWKIGIVLLIVLVIAGVITNRLSLKNKGDNSKKETVESKSVKTALIEKMDILEKIEGNGEAEPAEEAQGITETGGYIKEIKIRNGYFAKKGETVIVMHDSVTEQNYKTAQARYLAAKSTYERNKKFAEKEYKNREISAKEAYNAAKRAYDKAKRGSDKEDIEKAKLALETEEKNYSYEKQTYEKNKKLYEKGLISEQEFLAYETKYKASENSYKIARESLTRVSRGTDEEDLDQLKSNMENAKSSYELAKKYSDEKAWLYDLQAAESSYIAAEAEFNYAKEKYEELKLKAPVSGIITDLKVKSGDRVEKDTTLFTVVNNNFMKFEMGVTGKELSTIKVGSSATVFVEDVDKEFTGKVYEINPAADSSSKKFAVKVKVENKEGNIKKRMYGKIIIDGEAHLGIAVPSQAVVVQNLYSYIFIKDSSGKAKKVAVKTGKSWDKYQEIISDEIKPGEKVIIEGQFLLQDGDFVKEVK